MFFFFNDTATTEIYTLSLHDALPICSRSAVARAKSCAASSRGGSGSDEATRTSLRPPAVDAGLAGPGTTDLSVPLSGDLRLRPASRPPGQRTRPSPAPAAWPSARAPAAAEHG